MWFFLFQTYLCVSVTHTNSLMWYTRFWTETSCPFSGVLYVYPLISPFQLPPLPFQLSYTHIHFLRQLISPSDSLCLHAAFCLHWLIQFKPANDCWGFTICLPQHYVIDSITRKSCPSTAISPQLRIVPYKSIYLFIIVWVTLFHYYKSTRLPNCRWIFLRTAGDISWSFCGDQNCQFFTIRKIVSICCCGNQSRFFFLTQTQWVLCIYPTRTQWKLGAVQHWQTLSCNIKKC